jgi:hypothetical protein
VIYLVLDWSCRGTVSVNLGAGLSHQPSPAISILFGITKLPKPVIVKTHKTVYNNITAQRRHQKPRIRNAEWKTQAPKKSTNFQKLIMTLFREVRFASADIFVANSELQMYCLVAFRSPIG